MRLSLKGTALACGILWGGALLFSGVLNATNRRYARRYLELMSSVYPGYRASGSPADLLVGTAYAFGDGAAGGLLYAWLYNRFAGK